MGGSPSQDSQKINYQELYFEDERKLEDLQTNY